MANRMNEPSGYSKEKMLFLRDMFAEHSDTENGLRMVDIQDKVEREYGIRPDRKTIISDIDVLESYGVEIQRAAGGRKDYRLLKGKDDLNVMEVKILIDLILVHGKGNKERMVPVSPYLAKALMQFQIVRGGYFEGRLAQKFVFLSYRGRKMTQESITKVLKEAAKAVGVNPQIRVSPHTCRHTFAHLQLKNPQMP